MQSDEGNLTEFQTMRGRDYPTLRQFTVFLENRVGQLLEVVRRFEGSRVRIIALSIHDSTECAFLRLLLSHPEQGREILERAGWPIIESDLIALELPPGDQPLLNVFKVLLRAEVNVVQTYPLLVQHHGRPIVAIMVDNLEIAIQLLRLQLTVMGYAPLSLRDRASFFSLTFFPLPVFFTLHQHVHAAFNLEIVLYV